MNGKIIHAISELFIKFVILDGTNGSKTTVWKLNSKLKFGIIKRWAFSSFS